MKELDAVLIAFKEGAHCEAAVWTQPDNQARPSILARSGSSSEPPSEFPESSGEALHTDNGKYLVARVAGPRRVWLVLGECDPDQEPKERHLKLLLPVVEQFMRSSLEVEHAALELAERYEEINLLYTIGEILGRTVTLEDAAATILTEISETVGARHASILVLEPATNMLHAVAALGIPASQIKPISVDDPISVSARVFRTQHPVIIVGKEEITGKESPYGRGEMLSVPIMWTTPGGGEPLGVVNLADRRSRQRYTAGDMKLVTAIATQIGTAIQNSRLVSASLEQQRLLQELSLAHDLQMKLLPSTDIVAPVAEVTARVVPAESVGGDFYQLFRTREDTTGVMIGDVSGHGYRAALIMALAMSASAIHAQTIDGPAAMLAALLGSLREELASTEMFISVFYAEVDIAKGVLAYSNTGHPHAFVLREEGEPQRLSADAPPLGMSDEPPSGSSVEWNKGKDLLILFTDGISDARSPGDERLGEERVLEIIKNNRSRPTLEIVDAVFEVLREHIQDARIRDDLTLVILRS
jgi:sigma-B regulation protein RsbU (phosphoserine phosphatase)